MQDILVFDFGGGTFDVSLLTIDNGAPLPPAAIPLSHSQLSRSFSVRLHLCSAPISKREFHQSLGEPTDSFLKSRPPESASHESN